MTTVTAETPDLIRPVAGDVRTGTEIGRFLTWLDRTRGLSFQDYRELHHWSVTDLAGFWSAIWEYYEVHSDTPYESVLGSREMPGAQWFPGATLNYAQHAVAPRPAAPADDEVAIIAHSQTREKIELTWGELRDQVARARNGLQRLGVRRGDRGDRPGLRAVRGGDRHPAVRSLPLSARGQLRRLRVSLPERYHRVSRACPEYRPVHPWP